MNGPRPWSRAVMSWRVSRLRSSTLWKWAWTQTERMRIRVIRVIRMMRVMRVMRVIGVIGVLWKHVGVIRVVKIRS